MLDYYKILEVSKTASQEEIKQNYRMLAKKWHPDANRNTKESEEKFKEINEAYSHLSTLEKRREYDMRSGFQTSTKYDFNNPNNNRYNNAEWEFTYTTRRKKTSTDLSDYAIGTIVKGAVQLVVGVLLIPIPSVLSLLGAYAIYSGISNISKGISHL